MPRHFTSISRLGRVPSVSWDGIEQETVTIFDGGPQKARLRREVSRITGWIQAPLCSDNCDWWFQTICKDRDNRCYG